jgi:hypothetical protein
MNKKTNKRKRKFFCICWICVPHAYQRSTTHIPVVKVKNSYRQVLNKYDTHTGIQYVPSTGSLPKIKHPYFIIIIF